jgi:hypothetical protein
MFPKLFSLVILFILSLSAAQRFAIGEFYEHERCEKDTHILWGAVELNQCLSEGSIYGILNSFKIHEGKITCDGGKITAHLCFDSGCQFCQVGQERPLGIFG